VAGTTTGPLVRRILADQFERLRDGDRFWYQRVFTGRDLSQLEGTTLAAVIQRNTGVRGLQGNVFFFRAAVTGQGFLDRNGDGRLNRGESGLAGVKLELLNDEGAVIASTLTDRLGQYSFRNFNETGDYQVRVVPPASWQVTVTNPQSVLIPTGDVVV